MIHDSRYWKQPLLASAEWLRSLKVSYEHDEKTLAQLEREIFIGFYAVRKLFDAPTKITDATRARQVNVTWHPNRKPVDWRNAHAVDENYDFSISYQETREIWFLCGRIIHSYVFMPFVDCLDDDNLHGVSGLMFASDIDKDKKLYVVDIDTVIEIFELVGHDEVVELNWSKDPISGEETLKLL
ncbi:hypothetical protein [Methylosinus sporium]|uniref:hypothetical protein n=1 Tax=Methylosinus sporium TaxID=428 RepID=UPI00383B853B